MGVGEGERMRENVYKFLNRMYGIMMTVSFFGGIIPVIPFVLAIIIGGEFGERLVLFLYTHYYPRVIIVGSLAIIVGYVAMHIGKIENK